MSRRRKRAPSGRLLLRLPPSLHEMVQEASAAAGVSVNEYCVRRLAAPGPWVALDGPWVDVTTRALAMFGSACAGVIAHGSWARGEAADDSDVDVLIVVDASVPLTRALYRAWDEAPLQWQGRPVDVHFVHLPHGARRSSVWYEAAIEGVVICERGTCLSSELLRSRRTIAAGRVVRKVIQGHPYWTEAA